MTLRLSPDTHKRLKAICDYKGCTLQELARTAITEYLATEEERLGIAPGVGNIQ